MIVVNVISVLGYVLTGLAILRCHRSYTVLFGYVLFIQTWSLVSCFYNDLSIYNIELFRHTETTLATTRLALFYIVFNLGFLLVASILSKRPLKRRDYTLGGKNLRLGNLKLGAYIFGSLLLAYIVYSFVTGGIPILEGVQKVLFYEEAGPVGRFLLGYGFIIAFALGYFRRMRGKVSVNGVLLVVMLIYLVLTGNKFSALIRLVVAYYAAVFVQYWQGNPRFSIIRWRYVLIACVAVIVLALGAYTSYVFWGLNATEAQQLLLNRVLALQGHLWWATDYNLFVLDGFDSRHWLAELGGIVNLGEAAEGTVGMKYVMIQAIGAERAFPIFDTGYLYTMAYPAILVLTFSYPVALTVQLFMGGLFCALLYYLHYSLSYRHFLRALIAMSIIVPLLGMIGTGDFHVLLTPGVAMKLLILFTLELGVLNNSRRVTRTAGTSANEPVSGAGRAE